MNRRESLKSLLLGAVATGAAATGCAPDIKEKEATSTAVNAAFNDYGRTPSETLHDLKVMSETFFSESEMQNITILSDIILPATETAGSATEADVPAFIEFMVKDIPTYQTPLRGGLMWLEKESQQRFAKDFAILTPAQRIEIVEDIAYPDPEDPNLEYGVRFFNTLRNLVATGYYTTKMGFEDLGYVGNRPNVWDGVPAEILAEHDVEYDPEWLAKCVDQSKREDIAEWDDEMNLLT